MNTATGERLLVDAAREQHGLKMGGLHHGRHIGWTATKETADAMAALGASVAAGFNRGRKGPGWEISFAVGTTVPR